MIHDIFTLDRDESRFKHIIEIIGMIFCLTTEILFNYNLKSGQANSTLALSKVYIRN